MMKRNFNSSDSVTHFLSSSFQDEMNPKEDESSYNREFQAMLDGGGGGDGEDCILEEAGQMMGDRKRRLSNYQVKSLEKIFEVDNKLDPDRKVKVAQDLGLQPRQVAIWFQNRRARWKTKQLEKDYNHLKANYDALKLNYQKLEQEKETLTKQLLELKAKLEDETTDRNEFHDKEKTFFLETDATHTNHEVYTSLNMKKTRKLIDLKDGSSDSDSSGVLTEENIATSNLNGGTRLLNMSSYDLWPLCSSSTAMLPSNYLPFLDSRAYLTKAYQQQQPVKMEDQFLISNSEESCNIFSVDQAPNLCWYFPDQRNQ